MEPDVVPVKIFKCNIVAFKNKTCYFCIKVSALKALEMKKAGIALNMVSMALLHLVCCGLPLVMALGGSIGLYLAVKSYSGWFLGFHLLTVLVMTGLLYRPRHSGKLKWQKAFFWFFTVLTLGTYLFTHSTIFKSEEEILKQQHMERVFKRAVRS